MRNKDWLIFWDFHVLWIVAHFPFLRYLLIRASDKCQKEKRKTVNGDDLLWAMATLGFEEYIAPLKVYLARYREVREVPFLFPVVLLFVFLTSPLGSHFNHKSFLFLFSVGDEFRNNYTNTHSLSPALPLFSNLKLKIAEVNLHLLSCPIWERYCGTASKIQLEVQNLHTV